MFQLYDRKLKLQLNLKVATNNETCNLKSDVKGGISLAFCEECASPPSKTKKADSLSTHHGWDPSPKVFENSFRIIKNATRIVGPENCEQEEADCAHDPQLWSLVHADHRDR